MIMKWKYAHTPPSQEEIISAKNNKAPGEDGIYSELIKKRRT
jgi:hypothetical protein